MSAEIPGIFAIWAGRAHAVIDSQIRRRKNRKADQQQQEQQEQQPRKQDNAAANGHHGRQSNRQQPPNGTKKREWWRLDPNTTNRYKPVEPPATPDPDVIPTLDRIVFGWEAPLSPLEQVIQDDVRRHFPKFHEWIVRRAVERAGLLPPPAPEERLQDSRAVPPDPGLTDLDGAPPGGSSNSDDASSEELEENKRK
jgi:hypothetical protein